MDESTACPPSPSQRAMILMISHWYPSQKNPLAGIFIQEQARAVSIFDDVTVLHLGEADATISGWYRLDLDEGYPIPVYRLRWKRLRMPYISYLVYIAATWSAIQSIIRRGNSPDILHAQVYTAGVPAAICAARLRKPLVISEHSSAYQRDMSSNIELFKARFALGRAAVVLPVSAALQKTIQDRKIKAHFRVIPNAIDPTVFYPKPGSATSTRQTQMLYVGSLDPVKGLPVLFAALGRLLAMRSNWRLEVIGDSPQKEELLELRARLGLDEQIHFHGFLPHREIAPRMRQADFLVLPSHVETFSVVIIEALACGIPVIATRCGGPEELITPENGILVPPGDANALYEAILWMMENLENFDSSEIARQAHERFSLQTVGRHIHQIYQECMHP